MILEGESCCFKVLLVSSLITTNYHHGYPFSGNNSLWLFQVDWNTSNNDIGEIFLHSAHQSLLSLYNMSSHCKSQKHSFCNPSKFCFLQKLIKNQVGNTNWKCFFIIWLSFKSNHHRLSYCLPLIAIMPNLLHHKLITKLWFIQVTRYHSCREKSQLI